MELRMRAKLGIVIVLLEIAMLVLFGVFVRYDEELGMPKTNPSTAGPDQQQQVTQGAHPLLPPDINGTTPMADSESISGHEESGQTTLQHMGQFYAMFQDIHVMMFIGFGFLMTFLKRYGFSSVGLNFLVAAFVLQWATLTGGWILHFSDDKKIHVNVETLINADFASAAVLISFGAVIGKVSAIQLLIMALIEVVVYQVNELIVFKHLHATDVGDSMVVHVFGAYFGLSIAAILGLMNREDVEHAEEKEGSIYHSDLFSMIGTIFLWLFWPSFNAGTAIDEGQMRAVVNTYYSLTASCVVAFAVSSFVTKDKFNMIHIQNSTLAGGVAIGTVADMIIQPWAAILVGSVAGAVSVLGFRFLTPFMTKRLKIHDTCGVNNLHGMPGVIAGLGGILAGGLATNELYGDGLNKIFYEGRTVGQLAGFQAAALAVSLGTALVGGLITGMILLIPIWDSPRRDEIFDDEQFWLMPPLVDERLTLAVGNGRATPPPTAAQQFALGEKPSSADLVNMNEKL